MLMHYIIYNQRSELQPKLQLTKSHLHLTGRTFVTCADLQQTRLSEGLITEENKSVLLKKGEVIRKGGDSMFGSKKQNRYLLQKFRSHVPLKIV